MFLFFGNKESNITFLKILNDNALKMRYLKIYFSLNAFF